MSLQSGTRVGPYEVVTPIGAGGMGEVYRARDTKLNRDVASKILPEAFALDPDRLARFKREAQVLASLDHPNIPPSTASKTQMACTRSCCSWWKARPSPIGSRRVRYHSMKHF